MYPRLFELGPAHRLHLRRPAGRGLPARPEARDGPREGARPRPDRVLDLGIYIIISALVGAKLLLLVTDFRTFADNPRELLTLARSGGVFYGGLILAVVVALWYIRRIGLPLWTTCDVFAPGIALGHVVGRFGCFFAGCCYGKPTSVPWAITFTDPFAAANVGTPLDVPLHPTQLYEAGAEALILRAAARDREAGPAVSRAGRSGCTCCSTRSRATSSRSSAAIRAARSASSRRRSSFRSSSRRSRWPCSSTSARRQAPNAEARAKSSAAADRALTMPLTVPGTETATASASIGFSSRCWPSQSRSQIQRLIKEGHVQVAGRAAKANQPVKAGQQVMRRRPRAGRPGAAARRRCRCRSSTRTTTSIVVDKPAGMVVHPAAGHASGTLVNALLHHVDDLSGIGGEKRPGIVHRLDRGTSGLMVVAKHDAAHEELARQFHDREVEKEYVALVWGEVQAGRRIDAPIGRDPANRKKMSARARRSREAVTRIVRAEHLGRDADAGAGRDPHRPHPPDPRAPQRHRPSDRRRFAVRRRPPARAGDLRAVTHLERPFLHAARLAFKHPADGRRMEFASELPDDLQRVLDELREQRIRLKIAGHELSTRRSHVSATDVTSEVCNVRRITMPIVYKGRMFSVEVERVRFPNGRT